MKRFAIPFILALANGSMLVANPMGPEVAAGSAGFQGLGSDRLDITVGDSAIINWHDFSIGHSEITQFIQPSAQAAVLNRVTGPDMSLIQGQLKANGEVYLINPHGVLIGPSGRIDAASFVASTLNLTDEAFLNRADAMFAGDSQASVINQGVVHAETGDIYLIASHVENEGELSAPQGQVAMVAETRVGIMPRGTDQILIRPDTTSRGSVEAEGAIETLTAELQSVGNPYALAVKQSGMIRAGAIKHEGGRVYLCASAGEVAVSGDIVAVGGEVRVLGDAVTLKETAHIDTSASSEGGNGGTIYVGGGYKGQDSTMPNSQRTNIESGAQLHAHGKEAGDGGTVIVWSDGQTRFSGYVGARGGDQGGAGGFAEISGKEQLGFDGTVELHGSNGNNGTLLLDPKFALIQAAGPDPATGQTFANNPAGTEIIAGAAITAALAGADVVIQCNTDCTVNDSILASATTNDLVLQTGRSTIINAARIIELGGSFHATVNDEGAIPANRDAGPALFTMAAGSSIGTLANPVTSITVDHGTFGGLDVGAVAVTSGSMRATGLISLDGVAPATVADGVSILGPSVLNSTTNEIAITGVGGTGGLPSSQGIIVNTTTITGVDVVMLGTGGTGGGFQSHGVLLISPGTVVTGSNSVDITGFSSGVGLDTNAVHIEGNVVVTSPTSISIFGEAFTATQLTDGVGIYSGSQILATGGGAIHIEGHLHEPVGLDDSGIEVEANVVIRSVDGDVNMIGFVGSGVANSSSGIDVEASLIESIGTGNVFMTGQGANGANDCNGIVVHIGSTVRTVSGTIGLLGLGGMGSGTGNDGIEVTGGTVQSTTGAINITGTATGSNSDNVGVHIGTLGLVTTAGPVNVLGLGNGAGTDNYGVAVLDTGVLEATGSGAMHVLGIGGIGTDDNVGVLVSGAGARLGTADGDLTIEGIGNGTGLNNYAVANEVGGVIDCTGLGNMVINSAHNDLHFAAPVTTAAGTMTLTAVNFSDSITCAAGGDITSGSDCIAAAARDITVDAGVTWATNGDQTFVVDEQFPLTLGPGFFTNNGTITSSNNNIAVYAVSGPLAPASLGTPPVRIIFGNLVTMPTWDLFTPAGLITKYFTSYEGGGPYHGPGFGPNYVPGNGNFGSPVVWYKYPGFTPFDFTDPLRLLTLNTDVHRRYFLRCPGGPCRCSFAPICFRCWSPCPCPR